MAHDYHGLKSSRAMRKQSKLGPGIIDVHRLEELLGSGPGSGKQTLTALNPHKQGSTDTKGPGTAPGPKCLDSRCPRGDSNTRHAV
jgi:hypothetical protein